MSTTAQACASCHARKVRCDSVYSALSGPQPCTACQKAGTECRPHQRKRRREASSDAATVQSKRPLPLNDDVVSVLPAQNTIHSRGPVTKASPQSSYLGRSEYVPAHVPIDEEDASRYEGHTHLTSSTDRSTVISTIPSSMRSSLVKSFNDCCRPWMPLLSEAEAMRRADEEPSSLLTTAIFVAGSKVSTSPKAVEVGTQCYARARMMFFAEDESDVLQVIMALIFLQWWNPSGPEHVSIHNSSFWLRTAVGLAHQIGLHREPSPKAIDGPLRRVIWWTLVSRDCQIATSHGRPRAINITDSDVRPLAIANINAVDDDDNNLFISFVHITHVLGDLTEHCLRGTLGAQQRMTIEERLLHWITSLPTSLRLHERVTKRLCPYNFTSRHIHVPYFVAITILFHQKRSNECPPLPSLLAASFISGIFEEYLDWGAMTSVSPASIFYIFTAALTQISSHRYAGVTSPDIAARELQIAEMSLSELKKRFATAYGAERVVRQTVHAMRKTPTASLTRAPTILTEHELEFFKPFGPELCHHWDLIQAARSGHATALPSCQGSPQQEAYMTRPEAVQMDGNLNIDSMPFFGTDAMATDLDVWLPDDAFERLWWRDWTTQPG
ncbi:hypothetical protein LTR86_006235 [Recurvomyces mirabilis]|nr:hypothetical protein LTR86_006235 [Recurvomyces mirabilis]